MHQQVVVPILEATKITGGMVGVLGTQIITGGKEGQAEFSEWPWHVRFKTYKYQSDTVNECWQF